MNIFNNKLIIKPIHEVCMFYKVLEYSNDKQRAHKMSIALKVEAL